MKTIQFTVTATVPDDVKAHRLCNALLKAVVDYIVPDYGTKEPVVRVIVESQVPNASEP